MPAARHHSVVPSSAPTARWYRLYLLLSILQILPSITGWIPCDFRDLQFYKMTNVIINDSACPCNSADVYSVSCFCLFCCCYSSRVCLHSNLVACHGMSMTMTGYCWATQLGRKRELSASGWVWTFGNCPGIDIIQKDVENPWGKLLGNYDPTSREYRVGFPHVCQLAGRYIDTTKTTRWIGKPIQNTRGLLGIREPHLQNHVNPWSIRLLVSSPPADKYLSPAGRIWYTLW